ncbi:hypothetical protein B0E52_01530 [Rhodanobacter sp. C06]|uniref:hypothetical protein n=1 Tax=Rhodanobacter sp. C06 TaxID=1945854 RepID=UPI0009859FBF|nr:hypothetical protein [Rhodanobacter sp. C06]OOG49282.1 hypothetical protein B0E52_01530 [Rhodanobacter sp. C06]
MATADIETVQSTLSPLAPILIRSYIRAWEDWKSAGYLHWRPRGRANFVWEQAAHYTALGLAEVPGVTVVLHNESYHFLVNDTVSFRLKKADSSGFTSNYPTQEALAFHDPQMPLTGVPAAQRVEVTYSLNRTQTDLRDIAVVAREGDTIAWTYSLLLDNSVASLPAASASTPAPSESTGRTGLVRRKGQNDKTDEAGDAG